MSIYEQLQKFCFPEDQLFSVFDWTEQENIFKGYLSDCPDEILEMEFDTIDNIYNTNDIKDGIVFSVDSDDEF